MKKNERLKAIVTEWLENKIGFSLSDKLAIKMVAEIIETEDEIKVGNNNINKEYIGSSNGERWGQFGEPNGTLREALEQASEHLKTQDSTIHYQSEKDAEPKEESDWISVSTSPKEHGRFSESNYLLLLLESGEIKNGYSHNLTFKDFDSFEIHDNITHWRHLPEPPKQ
jgi:hypothetical protein